MTKVSEYVAAGSTATGYMLFESPVKETEKALGFAGIGTTAYGNPAPRTGWFPRRLLTKIENDFYTNNAPAVMYLVPLWLVSAKKNEGWEIA